MDFIINPAARSRKKSLWRNPEFLKLWTGQTVSELGSRISREGIPLTAVLVLRATPLQMGYLTAFGSLAVLAFAMLAGIWVDRFRRRPIMIASDIVRAALLATIPVGAALGWLNMAQLYVVLAFTGILNVLFEVAYQSFFPSLAGRDQLFEGNSKLATSAAVAEVAGPGITGILVQLITAPVAILFDSLSFLISAASIWMIRVEEPKPEREPGERWTTAVTGGLRFIAKERVLRALAARSATWYLLAGFIAPLYVLYAIRDLRLTPAWLGLAIAVGGAGNLIGTTLTPKLVRRLEAGRTLLWSALVNGAALFFIPLAHGSLAVIMTFVLIQQLFGDASFAVSNVVEISVRQTLAPDHILGRVNSAMQLLSMGILPIGALIGGSLAGAIGMRPTLAIAAAGVLLSSFWLLPIRNLKMPA